MAMPAADLTREDREHAIERALGHIADRYIERQIQAAATMKDALRITRDLCSGWGSTGSRMSIRGRRKADPGIYVEVCDTGAAGWITWREIAEYARKPIVERKVNSKMAMAEERVETATSQGFTNILIIPLDLIRADRNVRRRFDEGKHQELVESIRRVGVLQPVLVVPDPEEDGAHYLLVAGERRVRAAREAGLTEIPAVLKELTPQEIVEVMLVENLHRQDLDAIEEADGYRRLIDECGYTQQQVAERVGVSQPQVANRLRLLRLPETVQDSISRQILSAGHGLALLKLEAAPEMQRKAAESWVENEVPARQADDHVNQLIRSRGKPLTTGSYGDPAFDTTICLAASNPCPKAVRAKDWSGEKTLIYCLDRECWDGKQEAALEAKREAVMAPVQDGGPGTVFDLREQIGVSYRHLDGDPGFLDSTRCEVCEHNRPAKHWNGGPIRICINPECFEQQRKQASERARAEEEQKQAEELARIAELARTRAAEIVSSQTLGSTMDTLVAALGLIFCHLDDRHGYGWRPDAFQILQERLGLEFDEEQVDRWSLETLWPQIEARLGQLSYRELLELFFYAPAAMQGLESPVIAWSLGVEPEGEPDEAQDSRFTYLGSHRRCRVCGCTDDHPCPDGCCWVENDLCSQCAEAMKLDDAGAEE